jgi:hypothetical protein
LGIGAIIVFGEQGKEDVRAADGGGVVPVGVAADGGEDGYGWIVYVEEYAEERWRVELAEAAAEGGRRADGAEEGGAGECRADEAREGGEVEKDLAQEVVAEVAYGGGSGWRGFLLQRRRRWQPRLLRGHVGTLQMGKGSKAQYATMDS